MSTCGCRRGHYLCPEGERLWDAASAAYRAAMCRPGSPGAWTEFERQRALYEEHMARAEEAAPGIEEVAA